MLNVAMVVIQVVMTVRRLPRLHRGTGGDSNWARYHGGNCYCYMKPTG
ncbi:hypothetical protein PtrM4_142190 [Pyrenophora tritici-repentis]|uniref:Uncharacterized protein n=1 Tax=Pyrenophora tritici-repentis TaxID=45151 RepID=A0A834RPB2_9PLEO|nr:hypothetical protein PtrM4_142190 [Pyrenophora tritici-repentis]